MVELYIFALALQPLLLAASEPHENQRLDFVFSYLDDCVLAGSAAAVSAAFSTLAQSAQAIGLKVAMGRDKSLLVPAGPSIAASNRALSPGTLEVCDDRSAG